MDTPDEIDIGTLIQRKPGVNGGRPCLKGTGMSVRQVAVLYREGATAEEIQSRYSHIGLELIYAAVAHYLANQAAMDAELEESDREYWATVKSLPPLPQPSRP